MNKHFKQLILFTLVYLWGMMWLIAGVQHSTDSALFKEVELIAQYIVESWPSIWILMCMVWGNILYATTGCFLFCGKVTVDSRMINELLCVRYFFAVIYLCLVIISILYFTKIVVMITTVQMMSQFIDYQKSDNVSITTTTTDDTILVGSDVENNRSAMI